jgi:hypothetical protein
MDVPKFRWLSGGDVDLVTTFWALNLYQLAKLIAIRLYQAKHEKSREEIKSINIPLNNDLENIENKLLITSSQIRVSFL